LSASGARLSSVIDFERDETTFEAYDRDVGASGDTRIDAHARDVVERRYFQIAERGQIPVTRREPDAGHAGW
jgi:hypothetical protein